MAIKFSAIKFSVLTLQGQRMNFSVSPNPNSAGPVVNLKLKTLVFRSYWTKPQFYTVSSRVFSIIKHAIY